MAFIESAFYGDEKSQRNATKVVADKITGTSLEVDVNEQLIPPFVVAERVSVTSDEEEDMRAEASRQCGPDQDCIRQTVSRLMAAKLTEKQTEANSSATAIKGRRLTVNIIDETGQRRRIVIPDGQKFSLDNVSVTNPTKGGLSVPPAEYFQKQVTDIGALILSTSVYVFGVAATYTLLMQGPGLIVAVPATAVAAFIPNSGYVLIFLYFMLTSAVNTYIGKV
jgi:hypothetical protein